MTIEDDMPDKKEEKSRKKEVKFNNEVEVSDSTRRTVIFGEKEKVPPKSKQADKIEQNHPFLKLLHKTELAIENLSHDQTVHILAHFDGVQGSKFNSNDEAIIKIVQIFSQDIDKWLTFINFTYFHDLLHILTRKRPPEDLVNETAGMPKAHMLILWALIDYMIPQYLQNNQTVKNKIFRDNNTDAEAILNELDLDLQLELKIAMSIAKPELDIKNNIKELILEMATLDDKLWAQPELGKAKFAVALYLQHKDIPISDLCDDISDQSFREQAIERLTAIFEALNNRRKQFVELDSKIKALDKKQKTINDEIKEINDWVCDDYDNPEFSEQIEELDTLYKKLRAIELEKEKYFDKFYELREQQISLATHVKPKSQI